MEYIKTKKWMRRLLLILGLSWLLLSINNPMEIFHWTQENIKELQSFAKASPIKAMTVFFFIRFIFAVISIPGTGALTLLAGAIFGFAAGSALVLTSVSLGMLVAFLLTRYYFKTPIEHRFQRQFEAINQVATGYGGSLLFLLRMIEVVPAFLINAFFAVTSMKAGTYFIVSFISIIPGVMIFVNAGRQITRVQGVSDLLSHEILLAFALVGVMPLVIKMIRRSLQRLRDTKVVQSLR